MKKKLTVLAALILCAALLALPPACLAAAAPALSADFESGPGGFIPAGDLNGDGAVDDTDFTLIRDIVLSDTSAAYSEVCSAFGANGKYSDTNGDGAVNILDIVRTKKSAVTDFISPSSGVGGTGGMNVQGNVSYKGDITGKLTASSQYSLSLSHKGTGTMKVTLRDIGDREYTFTLKPSEKWKTNKYSVITPASISASSDIQVSICGEGIIDNFEISASAVDNDLADNW